MTKICHELVAKTAKDITASCWEIMSSDDRFHRTWPKCGNFVRAQWRNFIGHARASLAVILATPMEPELERVMKEPIYEAFLAEGGFKHVEAKPIAGVDGFVPTPIELARYGGLQ